MGLINGETLWYIRTCNNKDDFTHKVTTFSEILQERGYKKDEITQISEETDHTTRETTKKQNQTNEHNHEQQSGLHNSIQSLHQNKRSQTSTHQTLVRTNKRQHVKTSIS